MKTLLLFLTGLFMFFLFFAGCLVTVTGDVVVAPPDSPGTLKIISIAILGVYEVLVRAIPSIGDYSVVSWSIKFLSWLSTSLNRRP